MLDEMNDLKKSNKEMKQKFDDSMEKVIFHINLKLNHTVIMYMDF